LELELYFEGSKKIGEIVPSICRKNVEGINPRRTNLVIKQ
jgi:hypothetical protein